MRIRPHLVLLLVFSMPFAFGQKPEETFEKTVKPFLTKNCLACHNPSLKTAQLDLAPLRDTKAAMAERDVWENVLAKLKSGQMPPASAPKPDREVTALVTEWMEAHIERYDRGRKVDPGRVTARRLNRAEYNNTIRDLLGVSFRPADDFPIDDSGYGFDNIGDVLSLSPSLMEKYLRAAGQIVKLALRTGAAPKPMV
ncbi:MAG: DUF1587 domain-containing protein, partial [Acidobacteriia bacterium]|nr:DUF1587 domain-containing protein [Terriglobia bacterium]